MLLRVFFALMLALGLTGAATADFHDPIPHCFPCPDGSK